MTTMSDWVWEDDEWRWQGILAHAYVPGGPMHPLHPDSLCRDCWEFQDSPVHHESPSKEIMEESMTTTTTWTPVSDDEATSLLGEGIHTGLRKGSDAPEADVLWHQINDSGEAWSDALGFAVWGLETMGYAVCKKTETTSLMQEAVGQEWRRRALAAEAERDQWKDADSRSVDLGRRYMDRALAAEAHRDKLADKLRRIIRRAHEEGHGALSSVILALDSADDDTPL